MKTVIITGHASGIGNHTIRRLHSENYKLIGIDINIDKSLDKSITQISCDLCNTKELDIIFKNIKCIDIAINCAGVSGIRKSISDLTYNEFLFSFNKIFMPTFNAMQQEIKIMNKNKKISKIINIASSTASMGAKNMVAYSSAKAAIINLTKVSSVEHAPKILINSISPASIDTPMLRKKYKGKLPDFTNMYLTETCGSVSDVYSVINMFIFNDFITGQDIIIDGGYSTSFLLR
ncbi:SDR family NAD(P)-dependent oxidoreductase [Arsenophonus endosymbiont of Apis mellifera]|uniref:SDR family NAD(P)-dependent oxidoreductase n=1 Tax=Arsenophonus endosymbiont of Apis mellifera TaxID=1541805 RepID=UPI0015D6F751|nr:SDR family oxidoreductase [Arsenophonus endosymbiont of Apis mellifera]